MSSNLVVLGLAKLWLWGSYLWFENVVRLPAHLAGGFVSGRAIWVLGFFCRDVRLQIALAVILDIFRLCWCQIWGSCFALR